MVSPVQVRPSPLLSAADPHALLDLAVRAAQAAGALLVERFHRPASGVELKSSQTDPVSDADRDATAGEGAVLQPLLEQPVEHRHVLSRPVDAPPPFGRERRVGDAWHGQTLCGPSVHCRGAAR